MLTKEFGQRCTASGSQGRTWSARLVAKTNRRRQHRDTAERCWHGRFRLLAAGAKRRGRCTSTTSVTASSMRAGSCFRRLLEQVGSWRVLLPVVGAPHRLVQSPSFERRSGRPDRTRSYSRSQRENSSGYSPGIETTVSGDACSVRRDSRMALSPIAYYGLETARPGGSSGRYFLEAASGNSRLRPVRARHLAGRCRHFSEKTRIWIMTYTTAAALTQPQSSAAYFEPQAFTHHAPTPLLPVHCVSTVQS